MDNLMKVSTIQHIEECLNIVTPDWCYQSNSKQRIANQYEQRFINALIHYMNTVCESTLSYQTCNSDVINLAITYASSAISAFDNIIRSYDPEVVKGFIFQKQDEMDEAYKYFEAINIYLVNPLTTRRHDMFGIGEYIPSDCFLLRALDRALPVGYIHLNGLYDKAIQRKKYHAFFLAKNKNEKAIGDIQLLFSMDDISYVLQLYVDKFIELNKYLNNFKV